MTWTVYLVHAEGQEDIARRIAAPLEEAGYEVFHADTVMVGDSVVEAGSRLLALGGPLVICGTIHAVGTSWPHRLVSAARKHPGVRVFALRIEKQAYLEQLALDTRVVEYWDDPHRAMTELTAALRKYYPLAEDQASAAKRLTIEQRYTTSLLALCDFLDLANLPQEDQRLAAREIKLRELYIPLTLDYAHEFLDQARAEPLLDGPDALTLGLSVHESRLPDVREEILSRLPDVREEILLTRHHMAHRTARQFRTIERFYSEGRGFRVDRMSIGDALRTTGNSLRTSARLLILGEPGSGKTTLLRWITTQYLLRLAGDRRWSDASGTTSLPERDWMPLLIRCRDLDQLTRVDSLESLVRATIGKAGLTSLEVSSLLDIFWARLRDDRLMILIDGLDEITDLSLRMRLTRALDEIATAHPRLPLIITCRPAGYREMRHPLQRVFTHLLINDFSDADKMEFIRKWCALTQPRNASEAASELVVAIRDSDRIGHLTGNPLLLTTVVLVKRKVGKLPTRRVDLYREALDVLLHWRSDIGDSLDRREVLPQLGYIAYSMCARGTQQLREDELLALLRAFRDEYRNVHTATRHTPERFLELVESRTALLTTSHQVRHDGWTVPVYEFRHLSFQEYLASVALLAGHFPGRISGESLAEHVGRLAARASEATLASPSDGGLIAEHWREVLRLCLASCNDDDADKLLASVYRPVAPSSPTHVLVARTALAGFCLADEPHVMPEAAHRVLLDVARCLDSADVQASIVELGVSCWAADLSRYVLAEFLKLSSTIAAETWVYLSRNSRVPNGNPDRLMSTYEAWLHASPDKAAEAALSLVMLAKTVPPSPDVIVALVEALRASAPVTQAAAWALRAWIDAGFKTSMQLAPGQLATVAFVAQLATTESVTAAHLMHVIVAQRSRGAVPDLLNVLAETHGELRLASIHALEDIGDSRATEALKRIALGEVSSNHRVAAIKALGTLGDPLACEVLIDLLQAEDLQAAASSALLRLPRDVVVESLLTRLTFTEDLRRRCAVARLLGILREPKAIGPLMAQLDANSEILRDAIGEALVLIATGVADVLRPLLDDPDDDRFRWAARALGQLADERAVPALIARLWAGEPGVRGVTVEALSAIGAVAVDTLIVELARHPIGFYEKIAALRVFRRCGAAAIHQLIEHLDVESPAIRRVTIELLGVLHAEEAVDALIERFADERADIRRGVVVALDQIGVDRSFDQIAERLHDPQEAVRRSALELLAHLLDDDTNRKLLSTNLDGDRPFLDPLDPIRSRQVDAAAERLNLTHDEIRTRYLYLRDRLGLRVD